MRILGYKFSELKKFLLKENSRVAVLFSMGSMAKTAGTILGGMLVIRWVEPAEIGLWQSLMIISTYSSILQLGVMTGLNRELPFLMGAGKFADAKILAANAQGYALTLTAITLILTLISVITYGIMQSSENEIIWGIAGVGTIISLRFYHNYLGVTFRAEKSFKKLAYVYFIQFFILISALIFVYYGNFKGLVIYFVFCEVVITIAMHIIRPLVISPLIKVSSLIKLIKLGLPIYTIGYFQQISKSFTRIILLYSGGTLAVGLFAPANAIHVAIVMLPGILAQYIYPKMSYTFGKTGDTALLWDMVKKITFGFLILSTAIAIPGWFIIPPFIEKFFPNYTDGVFAAQLTMVSAIFSGTLISINSLYSVRAIKPLVHITIFMILTYSMFPYFLTFFFPTLNAVAMGNLIATIITFAYTYFTMKKVLKNTIQE